MDLKLITLNVEGILHTNRVLPFLREKNADVITLQEAAESYCKHLEDMGYHVSFAPRVRTCQNNIEFIDGELIATKIPHHISIFDYFKPSEEILLQDIANKRTTNRQSVMVATFTIADTPWCIASTHFTWAPDGRVASSDQKEDLESLLNFTKTLPPHIMTGDFNIPRHHNELYPELTNIYSDTIPEDCKSSLDKEFHIMGTDPTRALLFTDFMVDYIFSQPPYVVSEVEQHFGLSDHSAFTARISQC